MIAVVPAGPEQQAQDQSVPRRTSTAKLVIGVVPDGPEQQAPDQSGPRRTSTASARSQWSPPDLNSNCWMKVILAGPRPQRSCEDISDRMPERMSEDMPDTYAA